MTIITSTSINIENIIKNLGEKENIEPVNELHRLIFRFIKKIPKEYPYFFNRLKAVETQGMEFDFKIMDTENKECVALKNHDITREFIKYVKKEIENLRNPAGKFLREVSENADLFVNEFLVKIMHELKTDKPFLWEKASRDIAQNICITSAASNPELYTDYCKNLTVRNEKLRRKKENISKLTDFRNNIKSKTAHASFVLNA